VKAYYDARAPEYDEWYLGLGRFAELDRPGWAEELAALAAALAALPPGRTLDVACGTAFLSRHLRGRLTLLDASERMLGIAAARCPDAETVLADALEPLPFADGSFDRVLAGHLYGHLTAAERTAFLGEARRLAPEVVLVDSALRDGVEAESVQTRVLNDGSEWRVVKRYFRASELLDELGGGRVLHGGKWFLAVASP
jgi:ubiquinone/menaquinone biosynthesis C-methylase UbiE